MSEIKLHSVNIFDTDGIKVSWQFQFDGVIPDSNSGTTPYLYPADVLVQELYTDSNGRPQAIDRVGTLIAPNEIRVEGAPIVAGRRVRIYRATEIRFPLVDYRDRQVVSEMDLDLQARQSLFVAMEVYDAAFQATAASTNAEQVSAEALDTANTALEVAQRAETKSDSAVATANTAESLATAANALSEQALAAAAAAEQHADAVEVRADDAARSAEEAAAASIIAQSTSAEALTVANGIDAKASEALVRATTAEDNASMALITASGIEGYATSALAAAIRAENNSTTALSVANSIDAKATTALTTSEQAAADVLALRTSTSLVLDSIAALRSATIVGKTVTVLGVYSRGDCEPRQFCLDEFAEFTEDDGGSVIKANDGRIWSVKLGNNVPVRWFGAMGQGGDQTAQINRAFACSRKRQIGTVSFDGGFFGITNAGPGLGYALLTLGQSVIGAGAANTMIFPLAGTTVDCELIRCSPDTNQALDYMELRNFFLYPGVSGTKYGGYGIVVDMSKVTNASSVLVDGVYVAPGNATSLIWYTTDVNIQGGPANSVIQRCAFWEGVDLVNHGDSVTVRNVVLRSTPGSGRIGIRSQSISAGGGAASQLTLTELNIDADGGAVVVRGGFKFTLTHSNIEQSHGTGSGSGAIVDIDGDVLGLSGSEITNNSIGAFGDARVDTTIRINRAYGTQVSNNRMSIASALHCRAAIGITSLAVDTKLEGNIISDVYPVKVDDAGSGTAGVPRFPTVTSGWGAAPGTQPVRVIKDLAGAVHVSISALTPTTTSITTLCTLPTGFRPTEDVRAVCTVTGLSLGGSVEVASVIIRPTGIVELQSPVTASRILGGGCTFSGQGWTINSV